eukprot:COSAG02_NODE_10865_length_1843_cov_3.879587_3_plen_181_part_00
MQVVRKAPHPLEKENRGARGVTSGPNTPKRAGLGRYKVAHAKITPLSFPPLLPELIATLNDCDSAILERSEQLQVLAGALLRQPLGLLLQIDRDRTDRLHCAAAIDPHQLATRAFHGWAVRGWGVFEVAAASWGAPPAEELRGFARFDTAAGVELELRLRLRDAIVVGGTDTGARDRGED